MSRLPQDMRLAFRGLWRTPAFTISAVLILGIGIGMAVAMWSVFSAVLLRRLPLQDPDRVVMLRVSDRAGVDVALLPADVDRFRRESRTVRAIWVWAQRISDCVIPTAAGSIASIGDIRTVPSERTVSSQ